MLRQYSGGTERYFNPPRASAEDSAIQRYSKILSPHSAFDVIETDLHILDQSFKLTIASLLKKEEEVPADGGLGLPDIPSAPIAPLEMPMADP